MINTQVSLNQQIRSHSTPLGLLPSVTAILSATRSHSDMEKLRKWQYKFDQINGVGASEAYAQDAKNKGTIIHKLIQMQLEGKKISDCYDYPEMNRIKSFLKTLDVIAIEEKVYHPSGYSGIVDCVAKIDGNICLIDWKTSKRAKRKSWINDYFIQTAAYAHAWNYCFNSKTCNKLLIVILGPQLQIFEDELNTFLPEWKKRFFLFQSITIS